MFEQITQLRNYLFRLDDDIREILVQNVEFNELFKDLVSNWVAVKIEIQEYLGDSDRKIKTIKDKIVDEMQHANGNASEQKINLLSSILFQGHIQTIISLGIDGFKRFNDNFTSLNLKLDNLLKKSEFVDAKKLIEMNSKQIQNFIEEYENQIDSIIGKLPEDNNIFNKMIRPSITKFVASKEMLINRLKKFTNKNIDKIYLNQIKYYLDVINPIKLENLASYLELDIEVLKENLVRYINKNKLNAKIIKDNLYSPKVEDIIESKDLLFFKNIKTIGNKIFFNFKLNNPTSLHFRDVQISLKTPDYLEFLKKESFPKYLHIREMKPGNVFKFNYVFKIDKNAIARKNLADPSVDEVNLNLLYKDPFDINRKTTKRIDLLLP